MEWSCAATARHLFTKHRLLQNLSCLSMLGAVPHTHTHTHTDTHTHTHTFLGENWIIAQTKTLSVQRNKRRLSGEKQQRKQHARILRSSEVNRRKNNDSGWLYLLTETYSLKEYSAENLSFLSFRLRSQQKETVITCQKVQKLSFKWCFDTSFWFWLIGSLQKSHFCLISSQNISLHLT